jgi:hypothetical protein
MKIHKPTITDFTSAQHDHSTAAKGGAAIGGTDPATAYSGATLTATNLSGTLFSGTNVKATTISATSISATNFSASVLTATSISSITNLHTTNICATTVTATTFSGTNVKVTTLSGALTPRIITVITSATPAFNTDNCDCLIITAQGEAITSMTTGLAGTPTECQKLIIRIKDDGTARAITWGASFSAMGAVLPTTTVISKVTTVGLLYDTVISAWGCIAAVTQS